MLASLGGRRGRHGRGGVLARVWKTSEQLSDLDQWLNIAKHDPK